MYEEWALSDSYRRVSYPVDSLRKKRFFGSASSPLHAGETKDIAGGASEGFRRQDLTYMFKRSASNGA